jgi:hypothetical protein
MDDALASLEEGYEGSKDITAFLREVPDKATVAARVNETADGVILRFRNEIYAIPKENLQDGLYAQFGAFSQIRMGQTLDTETRLNNNIFAQAEPGSGRYTWSWKPRLELGYQQIEALLTRTIAEERKRQNPGSLGEFVKSFWSNDNSVSDIEIQQEVRKELGTIRARFGQKPAGIREAMHYEMLEKMHEFISNLSHPMERTVGGRTALAGAALALYVRSATAHDVPIVPGLLALPLIYAVTKLGGGPSNYVQDNFAKVVNDLTPAGAAVARARNQPPVAANRMRV